MNVTARSAVRISLVITLSQFKVTPGLFTRSRGTYR